jgi:hypothetical protein
MHISFTRVPKPFKKQTLRIPWAGEWTSTGTPHGSAHFLAKWGFADPSSGPSGFQGAVLRRGLRSNESSRVYRAQVLEIGVPCTDHSLHSPWWKASQRITLAMRFNPSPGLKRAMPSVATDHAMPPRAHAKMDLGAGKAQQASPWSIARARWGDPRLLKRRFKVQALVGLRISSRRISFHMVRGMHTSLGSGPRDTRLPPLVRPQGSCLINGQTVEKVG